MTLSTTHLHLYNYPSYFILSSFIATLSYQFYSRRCFCILAIGLVILVILVILKVNCGGLIVTMCCNVTIDELL